MMPFYCLFTHINVNFHPDPSMVQKIKKPQICFSGRGWGGSPDLFIHWWLFLPHSILSDVTCAFDLDLVDLLFALQLSVQCDVSGWLLLFRQPGYQWTRSNAFQITHWTCRLLQLVSISSSLNNYFTACVCSCSSKHNITSTLYFRSSGMLSLLSDTFSIVR